MPGCAVTGCNNYNRITKGTNIKYFRFPLNEDLQKQWVIACRRKDAINLANACICSVHFDPTAFEIPMRHRLMNYSPKNFRNLKNDAVPTKNLPCQKQYKTLSERSVRLKKREQKTTIGIILQHNLQEPNKSISAESGSNVHEVEPVEETVTLPKALMMMEQNAQLLKEHEMKISELKSEITKLKITNDELLRKVDEQKETTMNDIEEILATIFTPGQIKKLLHPDKKVIYWTPEDIAAAISLRSVSPKAYRYLRKNNFPLPCLSTLRSWARTFKLNEGILDSVLNLMEKKALEMNQIERLCFLSFDEIHISNKIDIDKETEQKVGPHKSCQTVMARGLVGHWKQPVYYKFDQQMTKDILFQLISKLHEVGFVVIGIVSDMATSNVGLWSHLEIGHNKNCHFRHPSDQSLKVYVFADVPHLLKLLRNHLLDQGFLVDDCIINRECFEMLLTLSTTELTLAHRLTKSHLDVKGSERQRVKPAVQLLSASVSKAIKYCGERGLTPTSPWRKVSEFVQLLNDWFDLFNSRSKFVANCPGRSAFGTDLEKQNKLLDQVSKVISSMVVGKHKSLLPFQKGILLSNKSLSEMFDYVHKKYTVEYILTSRLNQDVLENFFAYIRGMGGANEHPAPLDFKYRLRWFILGKNSSAVFTEHQNTEENRETCLLKPLDSSDVRNEICLTKNIFSNVTKDLTIEEEKSEEYEVLTNYTFVDYPEANEEYFQQLSELQIKEKINHEALKYLAGYVAYRFRDKYNNLGCSTKKLSAHRSFDWLTFVSRGNLLYPNKELLQATLTLDSEFREMHGTSLSSESNVFKNLASRTIAKLENNTLPHEVILCLSRTRTYIRLRDLNRRISFENTRRKLNKKMTKFTNCRK